MQTCRIFDRADSFLYVCAETRKKERKKEWMNEMASNHVCWLLTKDGQCRTLLVISWLVGFLVGWAASEREREGEEAKKRAKQEKIHLGGGGLLKKKNI